MRKHLGGGHFLENCMSDNSEANIPEDTIIDLEATDQAKKDLWLAIFLQLNQFPLFSEFINANYEIRKGIDEEKKVVEVQVVQKSKVTHPVWLTLEHTHAASLVLENRFGVKNASQVVNAILTIFATPEIKKDESRIVAATEEDLKQLDDLTGKAGD